MKQLMLIMLLVTTMVTVEAQTNKTMTKFTLPTLKYDREALAPVISKSTIDYHYGKHLQTYINNLNNLIVGTEFEEASLEDIIKKSEGGIFNNAAQSYNHQFYFDTFSPTPKLSPTGALLSAIEKQWGTVDEFKKAFNAAGLAIFGSGWVWLACDAKGDLSILKCANGDNPLKAGLTPLLGADVWEHAYYLDYQNRRADHLSDLWKITDWAVVEQRYNTK